MILFKTHCVLIVHLTFLIIIDSVLTNDGFSVKTTSGRVTSTEIKSKWGEVSVFYGVPYALSPVNHYRFQPAVPLSKPLLHAHLDKNQNNSLDLLAHEKLDNRVNSDSHPPACIQPKHIPQLSQSSIPLGGTRIDEDCLKLNIYVPNKSITSIVEKLPIFVFIPGDGLNFADSVKHDGTAIAVIGRVIVVTINYRVGVFGFLSTGGKTPVSGNAGLTDILAALEWVKVNGESFGGDTSMITIGSTFSGAMAVSALMTSSRFVQGEKKEPLANGVIFHNGVGVGKWIIDRDPIVSFYKLASLTDCSQNSDSAIVECLQNLSVEKLLDSSVRVPEMWKIVVDNITVHRDPLEVIEFGGFPDNVSVMIGENSGSGSICYLREYKEQSQVFQKILEDTLNEEDLTNLIRESLKEFFGVDDEGLATTVAHEYIYSGLPENSYRQTFDHFCGTLFIRNPAELAARYISRFQPNVYRYEFSYRPDSSPHPEWLGSAIGDETMFLFPSKYTNISIADLEVYKDIMEAWINFIRNGNPGTIKPWPEFDEETKRMVIFTSTGIKMNTSHFLDRDVHFWREAFPKLLDTFETGYIYKNGPLHEACQELLQDPKDKIFNATNYLLVFLIFLGVCAILGVAFYGFRNYKKYQLLFNTHTNARRVVYAETTYQ